MIATTFLLKPNNSYSYYTVFTRISVVARIKYSMIQVWKKDRIM